jgi:hypothetical protein
VRRKLGDLLVEEGALTKQQLQTALDYQRRHPGVRKLGETLIALKLVSEDQILAVLARALNVKAIELKALQRIEPGVLKTIDANTADRELMLPLNIESRGTRRKLVVAMADPTNLMAIDNLQFKLGMTVEPRLSTVSQMREAIRRFYFGADSFKAVSVSGLTAPPTSGDARTWVGPMPHENSVTVAVGELKILSGPGRGQTYPLNNNATLVVGRGADADIVVADGRMSRRHFQVASTVRGIELMDLGSSNGTFLNKQRLTGVSLIKEGDWIQAGNTVMKLASP